MRDGLFLLPSNVPRKINKWWTQERVRTAYPGLYRVALGIYGMLPGSGSLECDIGTIGDLVTPKRSAISPGMVEAMSVVRINKNLSEEDLGKIKKWATSRARTFPTGTDMTMKSLNSHYVEEYKKEMDRDDEYGFVQDAEPKEEENDKKEVTDP